MPKWLGAILGGISTVIFVGSAWLIVDLTRPARAAKPAVAVAVAPTAAAPAPAVETPAPAAEAKPAVKVAKNTSKKSSKKSSKTARRLSPAQKHAVLAKHDSKASRKSKNDIDRLLGL